MNPLQQIVRAGHARATHQRFAIDALSLVQTEAGKRLSAWLLRYYRRYLQGAVDPDIRIRDFQNQVVHVGDGYWGGAPRVAHGWYNRLQRYLRQRRFADAAHAAGVLSHYFTDPIQPLNTAYSPDEELIHLPLEWSVQRDYQAIYHQWRSDDLRIVFQLSDEPGWLGSAMLHAAKYAHQRYETLVQSYDLDAAVDDPPAGLTAQSRECLAEVFGLAITGWARVIERAASDVEAITTRLPPAQRYLPFLSAVASVPAAYWTNRVEAKTEDRQIRELAAEYRRKGKLQEHLPAEVDIKKRVIAVYRNERRYRLLREQRRQGKRREVSMPAVQIFTPEQDSIDTLALNDDDLKRLQSAEIDTLQQLCRADSADIAKRIQAYWITDGTVAQWQRQAIFITQVRGLSGHAARLLVGAGYQQPGQVVAADLERVHAKILLFAGTTAGHRCLQDKPLPTQQQVALWIGQIKSAASDTDDWQRKAA